MYIFFFGLLVSFDAFICGLSLISKRVALTPPGRFLINKKHLTGVLAVYSGVVSFIGSYLFSIFGTILSGFINVKAAATYAGLILMIISLFSFLESIEIVKLNFNKEKSSLLLKFIACGAVAADASLGALSLSLMGNSNYLYIASVFGVMHGIMIVLGALVSENKYVKRVFKRVEYLPMVIMFILGLSKIIL